MSVPSDDQSEFWEDRLEQYLDHRRNEGRSPGTISDNKTVVSRWIRHALSHDKSPEIFDQAAIDRFLAELDLGDSSRGSYTSHIRTWCQHWETQAGRSAAELVGHDDGESEVWKERLKEYLDHLRIGGLRPSTIDNSWSVLHRWIDYALSYDRSPEIFDQALVEGFLDDQNNLREGTRRSYTDNIGWWCEYHRKRFDAWVVRAGRQGEVEQHNLDHSVVTIGWGGEWGGDLDKFDDREVFGASLELWPEASDGTRRSVRDQIWRFGREIQVNDLVVMPQKRQELDSPLIAIGRVLGPYQYDSSLPSEAMARRAVEWLRTDISREVLGNDLNDQLNRPPTVYGLKNNDVPFRIQYLAEHGVDPGDRNPTSNTASQEKDPRSQQERLEDAAEKLLCDVSFLKEIVDLLEDKRQVILYGPPGTGKTYLAQALAEALAPEEQARSLVQFHPAYSYEDFFEGYRPVTDDDKQMIYELTPGPLAKLAEHAALHEEQHVMVIDEINRANLPRVLGELLFLLEYRDKSMAVMHRSDGSFSLPKNLWFIGTMNTADRSIALIDAAMRRRFHFVPFFPEREPTKSLLRRWTQENAPNQAWIPDLVSAVNSELEKELGGDHLQLGPSHFMKTDLNEGGFKRVWKYNIEPFIEDQLFGKPDKIKQFRLEAVLRRHPRTQPASQITEATDESELVSTPTKPEKGTAGRQNNDAMVTGQEIYDEYKAGSSPYTWMGRQSGLSGEPLRDDLNSGAWRSREYEVRFEPRRRPNWFSIEDFVASVDQVLNGPDSDESAVGGE